MIKTTKTYFVKSETAKPEWRVMDANGQTLGRLATRISKALQGKDKPTYTPHVLSGDFVVVINADKVRVTGTKAETKTYYRHSGYIGNLKQIPMKDMLEKKPEETILLAVKGMLPATKRGREMLGRLKIYTGDSNPHKSQTPESQEGR